MEYMLAQPPSRRAEELFSGMVLARAGFVYSRLNSGLALPIGDFFDYSIFTILPAERVELDLYF